MSSAIYGSSQRDPTIRPAMTYMLTFNHLHGVFPMFDKMQQGYEELKGTASELRDNRDYDRLVDMVGESGAKQAISQKLQDRGLTEQQWEDYRTVRTVLHQDPLKVREEVKEVSSLTEGVLGF